MHTGFLEHCLLSVFGILFTLALQKMLVQQCVVANFPSTLVPNARKCSENSKCVVMLFVISTSSSWQSILQFVSSVCP